LGTTYAGHNKAMKKNTLITLILLCLFGNVYSQTIENPRYGYSNVPELTIKKIEVSDTATVMYFHVDFGPGGWIHIPDQTFIKSASGSDKLFVKRAEGIPLNESYSLPASGMVDYKLIFPKLDKQVKKIDFGEGNEEGNWTILDIQIRPEIQQSVIPQELTGSWFSRQTGNWELSLLDDVAVYKSQVWNYGLVKLKKGSGTVQLKNKTKTTDLYIKRTKSGNYLFGESANTLTACSKDVTGVVVQNPSHDKPYEEPVFKLDSATYSGYINGYTSRIGAKTLKVDVGDIITGERNSFLVKISDNGYFTVKLPLYYPHGVVITSPVYKGTVFLAPGKGLFQMIGQSGHGQNSLFMGELAKMNADLFKLRKFRSYNYPDIR